MVWSSLKYQNPKTLKLVLILYLSHSLAMYPVQFDNKGKHWHLLYWHLLLKSYRHSWKKMSEWIISKNCCKNVFIMLPCVPKKKSHFLVYYLWHRIPKKIPLDHHNYLHLHNSWNRIQLEFRSNLHRRNKKSKNHYKQKY